jgi:8-oxo-dGTP pyrophosphatase MutT (NUDIX family)
MAWTFDTFREQVGPLLRREAPTSWDRSDDDMNAKARMIPDGVKPKPAAVLVGILDEREGLSVLLTQRKSTLSKHAGQIAFPGGRLDAGETALSAALREAEEEVGLAPRFVQPLGYLDGYLTVTGYFVVPVVALINSGHQLQAQAEEVDDIFSVPLDFLMEGANRQTHTREWNGLQRHYFVYPFGERYIWGATAGMIKNLSDRLSHGAG